MDMQEDHWPTSLRHRTPHYMHLESSPWSQFVEETFEPSVEDTGHTSLSDTPVNMVTRSGITGASVLTSPKSRTRIKVEDMPTTYKPTCSQVPEEKGKFVDLLRHIVLSVIYWQDVKVRGAILVVFLVVLFALTWSTFLHTFVLLLLSFYGLFSGYIIVRISIDYFYMKEVKNPLKDNVSIALPAEKTMAYVVGSLCSYQFNLLVRLLFFHNARKSFVFGCVLYLMSHFTHHINITTLIFLLAILLFLIPPLHGWFWQVPDTLPSSYKELQEKIKEVLNLVKRWCGEQEAACSQIPEAKENLLNHIVLFVIYWHDVKLSAVVLVLCLGVLWLIFMLNVTFLHTTVLLLLTTLVLSLHYVIIMIATDFFWNREIKVPLRNYQKIAVALFEKEVVTYALGVLSYYFDALLSMLCFHNTRKSLMFGVVLWLLSYVSNSINILTLLFLLVILLFFILPLYGWYRQVPDGCNLETSCELLDNIKEVLEHLKLSGEQKIAELKDLINELQGVTDWFLLGLCLGVPLSKLEEIKQDHRMNKDRRKAVLITWKHAEIETTWVKVVDALLEMGAHVHALYIAAKHGVPLPCSARRILFEEFQGRKDQDDLPHLGDEEQALVTGVPKPQLGLKDLLRELRSVTAWRNLGLHLDIPDPILNDIEESNSGNTDDCRREMLMTWMDLEVPMWARVVHALIHIGLPVLAAEIAHNHDVLIPKSVIEKTQPQSFPASVKQGAHVDTDANTEQTAVEQHSDAQLKEVPMTDLLTELQKVTDWFTLGVFLEVPTPVLKAIMKDWSDTDQCKLEMLIAWSNQETPTWPRVISALGEMGMTELALEIAHKYGIPAPPSLNEALERKAESARMLERQATQAGKHHTENPNQNDTGDGHPKEEEEMTVPEYQEGDMSLRQLVDELQEVVEWMPCGLYLGVAVATLKQIQKNHQTTPLCKQEMLYTWMRERRPTWLKVVEALVHIKMFRLAVKIASNYGVTVSSYLYKEMKGAMSQGELQRYHLNVEGRSDELDEMAMQEDASIGGAKFKDLVNELQEVTDWFGLGMYLRIPESVLMTIRRDIRTTSTCRQEMLTAWMKREVPTWSTLVKALLDMGMPDLANEIASKYFGGSSLQQQQIAMLQQQQQLAMLQQQQQAMHRTIQALQQERLLEEETFQESSTQSSGDGPPADLQVGPLTTLFLTATGLAQKIRQ